MRNAYSELYPLVFTRYFQTMNFVDSDKSPTNVDNEIPSLNYIPRKPYDFISVGEIYCSRSLIAKPRYDHSQQSISFIIIRNFRNFSPPPQSSRQWIQPHTFYRIAGNRSFSSSGESASEKRERERDRNK